MTFTKISSVASSVAAMDVHPAGRWVAAAISQGGVDKVEIYDWNGTDWASGTPTDTQTLASITGVRFVTGIAFNYAGTYLAIVGTTSPYIEVYDFTAATGVIGSKVADPASLPPDAGQAVAWAHDDSAIFMGINGSVPPLAYAWTGSAFGAKAADPSDVTGFDAADDVFGIAVAPSDAAVIYNVDQDKVIAWAWTGSAWGTRYTDGVLRTDGGGNEDETCFITGGSFNSSGTAIAFGANVWNATGSDATAFPWDDVTGFGTQELAPFDFRDAFAFSFNVHPSFHPTDDGKLLAPMNGGSTGEPVLGVFPMTGAIFSQPDLEVQPPFSYSYNAKWLSSSYVVVLNDVTGTSQQLTAWLWASQGETGTVLIDANADGDYDDAGEEVTADVRANPGIRLTRGRDQAREISPPRAGDATWELDNVAGTYSPPSTFGEGKQVKFQWTHAGTTYPLWEGDVQNVREHPELERQVVSYRAYGRLHRRATRAGVRTRVYANVRTGAAIGFLLNAAGFDSSEYVLDVGQTTLLYWWLDPDDNLLEKLNELLASEGPGAAIYEGGGDDVGKIVFKDRHARSTETRSTAIQATFRGTGTEPVMSGDFRYETGERNRINAATTTVYRRDQAAEQTIWTYGQQIVLSSNEARDFIISRPDNEPFLLVQAPNFEWVPPDFTYVSGSAEFFLDSDQVSGSTSLITMTAGADGAVMDDMSVRAAPLDITSRTVINNSLAPDGWTTGTWPFGIEPLRPMPDRHLPSFELGRAVALGNVNSYIAYYQNARPQVFFSVIGNRHDDAMAAILPREIGDRVRVIESRYGLDFEGHIEQISYTIASGPVVIAHFGIEALAGGEPMALDTDKLDSTTVLG